MESRLCRRCARIPPPSIPPHPIPAALTVRDTYEPKQFNLCGLSTDSGFFFFFFFFWCRSGLATEERTLETVRNIATRKKSALHAAKTKVQKLKEQLQVAERIVTATELQIEQHNNQVCPCQLFSLLNIDGSSSKTLLRIQFVLFPALHTSGQNFESESPDEKCARSSQHGETVGDEIRSRIGEDNPSS